MLFNTLIALSVSGVFHAGWAWESSENWGSFEFHSVSFEVSDWRGEFSFWPYWNFQWAVTPLWVSAGLSPNIGLLEVYPHIGAGWFNFGLDPEAEGYSLQVSGLLLNAGIYPTLWVPHTSLGIGARLDILHYMGVKEEYSPTIASLGFDLSFRFVES